jgi:glutathione S-transferase
MAVSKEPDTKRLVLFHNRQSRASMAHWMLEEVGADYELRHVDLVKGDNRSPEFLALNPLGKIPVLLVGETVITEVPAILAWLADAYPDASLAPAVGSPERGTWYRWLFFGGSSFEPAMTDELFKRPVPRRSAVGWGSFDDVVTAIEQGLEPGPYLLGDRFSAADVYIAAELSWARRFGVPRLAQSRVIGEYVERCTSRPAYGRAMGQAREAAP